MQLLSPCALFGRPPGDAVDSSDAEVAGNQCRSTPSSRCDRDRAGDDRARRRTRVAMTGDATDVVRLVSLRPRRRRPTTPIPATSKATQTSARCVAQWVTSPAAEVASGSATEVGAMACNGSETVLWRGSPTVRSPCMPRIPSTTAATSAAAASPRLGWPRWSGIRRVYGRGGPVRASGEPASRVRAGGVEPPCPHGHRDLNPACLPVPPRSPSVHCRSLRTKPPAPAALRRPTEPDHGLTPLLRSITKGR